MSARRIPFTVEEALGTKDGPLPPEVDREKYKGLMVKIENGKIQKINPGGIQRIAQVIEYQKSLSTEMPSQASGDMPEDKPQTVQEVSDEVKPGIEMGADETGSGGLIGASGSKSNGGQTTQKDEEAGRRAINSIIASMPPLTKPQSLEDVLSTDVPTDWSEDSVNWEYWAGLPTSKPSIEEFPHALKRSNQARDKRDYAVKVWDREVSRTFHNKEGYWYLNDNGRWGLYSKDDLLNILEGADLLPAGAPWSRNKAKAFLRRILTKNQVDFVGELAGHKTGVVDWKGDKYLVRKGPDIIGPKEGAFPTIEGLLLDLLEEEQLPYLYGWLKTSYEALRDGEMNTGQMLVFSGPPGIGKSFAKEFIIRPILGGRHTDPTNYLQGKTNFNADTSRAESWEIDDSVGTADSNKRKMLTGAIKKLTASNDHRIEGKFKDAIQPPSTLHRLSVYCNDEAYDLWVLPEMTGSTADKAIILKAHKAENPRVKLPGVKERQAFREQIEKELPAFIHHLTKWELPEELQNGRYGVKAYQQAGIAEALHNMSDEARLLEMIDTLLNNHFVNQPVWTGTSAELEIELRSVAREWGMSRELEKVLWNRQALGNGLGKLRKTNPRRVILKGQNWKGKNIWGITAHESQEIEWAEPKRKPVSHSFKR